jgi:hypothetical protein
MGEFILMLLFVCLSLFLLAVLLWFAVSALTLALPGGLCALAAYVLVRSRLITKQHTASVIADTMHPAWNGHQVACSIDDDHLRTRLGIRTRACLVACIPVPGILIAARLLAWNLAQPAQGVFGLSSSMRGAAAVLFAVLSLILTPVAVYKLSFRLFCRTAKRSADLMVASCNELLAASTANTERLDSELRSIAPQLEIEWPYFATAAMFDVVSQDTMNMLTKPSLFQQRVASIIQQAESDKAELDAARCDYAALITTYDRVVESVVAARAQFLFRKLEQIRTGIRLANEGLLPRRQWSTHKEVATGIQTDLEEVFKAAVAFSKGTTSGNASTQPSSASPITLRDAFEVFGLTDASATKQNVKERYRALVLLCHPDRGAGNAASMFKRVREAYEVITTHKKF